MIMIMMKPYLIITVLGTLTSSTLLQRAIAEEDATCALLGEDCYLSGLDCCDPFHDCWDGFCDIMPFNPAHGQFCHEDCSVCTLTAEECANGVCTAAQGTQCADLGKACSNKVPCCSVDHDCIASDFEGNYLNEGVCEVAMSSTGEECSGDDNCRFKYDVCVDNICKVSPSMQVDVSWKNSVSVITTGYDVRTSDINGCGREGCLPELTRDGIIEPESRWSCSEKLDMGVCSIVFEFDAPQDIVSMNIAFHKGDERQRTIQVLGDGNWLGDFQSSGTTLDFENWALNARGLSQITLTPINSSTDEWLSITEVELLDYIHDGCN